MDHIGVAIIGGFGLIFLLVMKTLVGEEVKAWTPWVTRRLVLTALRRLPAAERERYEEEWSSAAADLPGNISKILFALDLHRAGFGIRRLQRKSLFGPRSKGKNASTKAGKGKFFSVKISDSFKYRLNTADLEAKATRYKVFETQAEAIEHANSAYVNAARSKR